MTKFKKMIEVKFNLLSITFAWAIWKGLDLLWENREIIFNEVIRLINTLGV